MLDKLYENIGGMIKNLAKWTFVIEAIGSVIAGIVIMAEGTLEPGVGILLFSFGPIVAFVGSLFVYGFGELIEKVSRIAERDSSPRTNKAAAVTKQNNPQPVKTNNKNAKTSSNRSANRNNAVTNNDFAGLSCPNCNALLSSWVRNDSVVCPHCGTFVTLSSSKQDKHPLSLQELEEVVSQHLNRYVSVSEIDCTLVYVIPASTKYPQEMHLSMNVGYTEFSSLELALFDREQNAYCYNGKRLALDERWLPENDIFNFDVSLFKSFKTEEDNSD